MDQIVYYLCMAVENVIRPSVLFRPKITRDGNAFIALLGDNLQEGIVGVGDTPEEATRNFDKVWYQKCKSPSNKLG